MRCDLLDRKENPTEKKRKKKTKPKACPISKSISRWCACKRTIDADFNHCTQQNLGNCLKANGWETDNLIMNFLLSTINWQTSKLTQFKLNFQWSAKWHWLNCSENWKINYVICPYGPMRYMTLRKFPTHHPFRLKSLTVIWLLISCRRKRKRESKSKLEFGRDEWNS